jgi:hypothetical protein
MPSIATYLVHRFQNLFACLLAIFVRYCILAAETIDETMIILDDAIFRKHYLRCNERKHK